MVRKNKLYKHHKSKAFFLIRNFSFVFFIVVFLLRRTFFVDLSSSFSLRPFSLRSFLLMG